MLWRERPETKYVGVWAREADLFPCVFQIEADGKHTGFDVVQTWPIS